MVAETELGVRAGGPGRVEHQPNPFALAASVRNGLGRTPVRARRQSLRDDLQFPGKILQTARRQVLVLLRVYVVPELGSPAIRIAVQATGVIVVTLAVVLPIHCFLMKGNYVETLIAYAVSLAGAAMIMVAVRTVWHGILDGMASADKQKERKEQVEREISN